MGNRILTKTVLIENGDQNLIGNFLKILPWSKLGSKFFQDSNSIEIFKILL